jgi:hypothetical protein
LTETSPVGIAAWNSADDEGGGMLILFEAIDRGGPGLGGRDPVGLSCSESYEDMVKRLDFDCVDFDLRI